MADITKNIVGNIPKGSRESKKLTGKFKEGNRPSDDYDRLDNKPQINGVTLEGNKTTEDLNIKQNYTADDIPFNDGQTFQQKYDNGELKGEDGKTPVKGIDYFTETDKQEFTEEIKEKWKLIANIKVSEPLTSINISEDIDGNSLNLSKVFILAEIQPTENSTDLYASVTLNGTTAWSGVYAFKAQKTGSTKTYNMYLAENIGEYVIPTIARATSGINHKLYDNYLDNAAGSISVTSIDPFEAKGTTTLPVTNINIGSYTNFFYPNSIIKIWGVEI